MKEGWMKNDEGWMKDEWRMMKDERWMMKDDDFKLFRGFEDGQTDERTDIGDCRVAFATEKLGVTTCNSSSNSQFFLGHLVSLLKKITNVERFLNISERFQYYIVPWKYK